MSAPPANGTAPVIWLPPAAAVVVNTGVSVCAPVAAELLGSAASVETGVAIGAALALALSLDAGIAAAEEDELDTSGAALDTGCGTMMIVETADAVTVTLAVVSPMTMTLSELAAAEDAGVVMVRVT